MITFEQSGSFKNTEAFLQRIAKSRLSGILDGFGQEGVTALSKATPVESGIAANSWGYNVTQSKAGFSITWTNSDTESGFPVAVMLQYGYATGTGGYVQGRDYINPAMKPIFDKIADKVWKAVTSA